MRFTRPDFPRGLRVLVLDEDPLFRAQSELQLRQCAYSVTSTGSPSEAVALLRGGSQPGKQGGGGVTSAARPGRRACSLDQGARQLSGSSPFDVMLVEARLLLPDGSSCSTSQRKLVKLCRTLPFILMSSAPLPDEVMLGIKLGAAEFLEKPLCQLKLKNIWQHTVRRMMSQRGGACANRASARRASTDFAGAAAPGSRRASQDLPAPCSLLGSPTSDDVPAVPAGCWGGDDEVDPVLGAPNSPLTSGLFSSPTASSASYDFLLEPTAHCFPPLPADPSEACHPAATSYAATSAVAMPPLPSRSAPSKRCSKEQWFNQQHQHQQHQQHSRASPDITSAPMPSSLPPPPPPPPDLPAPQGVPSELPPPPPLCAPGMPWCPPSEQLPPGTEWGMPMNPMARAPGITPPVFQPPIPASSPAAPHAPGFPAPVPAFPSAAACGPSPPRNHSDAALMLLPLHLLSSACNMPAGGPGTTSGRSGSDMALGVSVQHPQQGPSSLLNSCELPELFLGPLGDADLHAHQGDGLLHSHHHMSGPMTSFGTDGPAHIMPHSNSSLCRRHSTGLDSELEQLELGLGGFKKVDSFVDLIQPLLAC